MLYKKFLLKSFPANSEAKGTYKLTPVELKDVLDFEVKRFYYVTDAVGSTTHHYHKEEKEFFAMLRGSCIAVVDYGGGLERVPLTSGVGIYVRNYVWHGFEDFAEGSVLLALASTNYSPDRSDYVLDYEDFKRNAIPKLHE